jgi:hypothetical protein
MSKKLTIAILALVALFGVGVLVTPVAKADINADVKDDLKGLLDDLKECIKDFKDVVKTELSEDVRLTRGDLNAVEGNLGDDTADDEVDGADNSLDAAEAELATVDIEAIEEAKAECEEILDEMAEVIADAQAEDLIDSTEADQLLADINALFEDLANKNDKLLDAELFVDDVQDNIDDAAALDTGADGALTDTDDGDGAEREASKLVRKAIKAADKALKIERQILDNIKSVRRKIGQMKRFVVLAKNKAEEEFFGAGVELAAERSGTTFRVQSVGVSGFQVQVYSLTGKLVYDSGMVSGPALRWNYLSNDGGTLANGVYLYTVTVQGVNGTYRSEVKKLAVLR